MAAITQDPLLPGALEGLKDERQLLTVLNRLQSEAGSVLNGGATLANAWRVVLTGVELVPPDEWVPLTPMGSFTDLAGNFAVRKDPYTRRVEVREALARAAGAPPAGTQFAALPAGFGPSSYCVRVADCDSGHGAYDVVPASGATPAQLRWQKGTPTAAFWLSGGSWQAEDPSIPPWEKPLTVRLVDRRVSASTTVRLVLCVARTADASAGILSTVTFPGASLQAPQKPGDAFLLVLPRVDGLKPGVRYTLTLWAFLE